MEVAERRHPAITTDQQHSTPRKGIGGRREATSIAPERFIRNLNRTARINQVQYHLLI